MYGFHPYIGTISDPHIPYNPYIVATLNIHTIQVNIELYKNVINKGNSKLKRHDINMIAKE